jgi:hypothetical protein
MANFVVKINAEKKIKAITTLKVVYLKVKQHKLECVWLVLLVG